MLYPYRLALEKGPSHFRRPLAGGLPHRPVCSRLVCSVSGFVLHPALPLYRTGGPPSCCSTGMRPILGRTWRIPSATPLPRFPTTGRCPSYGDNRRPGDGPTDHPAGEGPGIIRLHSVSGRPFDSMEGLCLQLETESADTASSLAQVCSNFPQAPLAALLPGSWNLSSQDVPFFPPQGSAFCYLAWSEAEKPALLGLLSRRPEGTALANVFSRRGAASLEFDWLWDAYCLGEAPHLLEWEMALRVVLEELGFFHPAARGFSR